MKENIQTGKKVMERMHALDPDFTLVAPTTAQIAPDRIIFVNAYLIHNLFN
jgi:hypothetical protein